MTSTNQNQHQLTSTVTTTGKTIREIESGLIKQGVAPLSVYRKPDPNVPYKTIPGIPREVMVFYIEAIVIHYAEYHTFPTPRELHEYTRAEQASTLALAHRVYQLEPFRRLLQQRGLPPIDSYTTVRKDNTVTSVQLSLALDPRQLLALSVMTDTSVKQTLETRLKHAGVTRREWDNWMRNPNFRKKFENIARETFIRAQSMIDIQLASGALEGKLDFIKYFNEVSGRHDPKQQSRQDVQQVLQAVVDIITRNITDTVLLSRISTELQAQLSALDL